MADAFTTNAGARYAFAPKPDREAASLHRICIVFEVSDGRNWTAGTELMAATEENAIDFCDQLNARLDLNDEACAAFAARIFAANPYRKDKSASEPSHLPQ